MITLIAGLLTSKLGASAKVAKIGAWVMIAALIVIVLGTAKCAYDKRIVDSHDTKVNLDAALADRKADTAAAEQRREDDARVVEERSQLERIDNATTLSPAERRLAKHRCLRLQQTARENGLQPPTCV